MSTKIWIGISSGGVDTRVLVKDGARTLMKARLSPSPAHPRALQWLLESVALWQGMPVRAVLSVGELDEECARPFHRDWFPDFGGPLYSIEWTDRARLPRLGDELSGLGNFGDLEQLQLFDALEFRS